MKWKVAAGAVGAFLTVGAVNAGAETLTGAPILASDSTTPLAPTKPHGAQSGPWSAPVTGSVSTPYGALGEHWASGQHTGIDFPVPTGTPVKAAADGEVVAVGWEGAYGTQVVIRHGELYSQYAHLSKAAVKKGQQVKAGDVIAYSGNSGNSTGPHLHFEVRTGPDYGSAVNPNGFLGKGE